VKQPARRLRLVGKAEYRDEAERLIADLGEAVIVARGRPRSLVLRCPDGCGQVLVVNLDERAGKAWDLDLRKEGPTLYPSVWREGGCESHFIVWRGRIIWCHRFMDGNAEPIYDAQLEADVLRQLTPDASHTAAAIATRLNELVWDVDRAARMLVRKGLAVQRKEASGWTFRAKA
jgi:hypothetical protein